MLFYQHWVVLPQAIQPRIIAGCHGTGHLGIGKTCERVATLYYWPCMRQTISEFVNTCAPCALQKPTNLKGMVHHPLEVVHQPREVVYVDLIGPVTGIRSEYRKVLTCVDGYSRYLVTRLIPDKQARTVAAPSTM